MFKIRIKKSSCLGFRFKTLKQFQLLRGVWKLLFFLTIEQFHHSELFIGNGHDADMAFRREYFLYTFDVYISIFTTTAMSEVNGKLKHAESIFHNILTKPTVDLPVPLCFCRKVKKY